MRVSATNDWNVQKLPSLKIGPRLALSFSILLVLTGLSTYMAVMGLSAQRRSSEDANKAYVAISAVQSDTLLDLDSARTVRDILLRADRSATVDYVAQLNRDKSESDIHLKELAMLQEDREARRLYEDMVSNRDKYGDFISRVVGMAMQDRRDRAAGLLYGPESVLQTAYFSSQRRLAEYTERQMAIARDRITATYRRSMLWLICTAIASLLSGSVLALLVARSIARPLADAVRIAESVGAGDLTVVLPLCQNDEPGLVILSLGRMADNLARLVRSVRSGADHIAGASREIASGNLNLSIRTEEQAASLEETTANIVALTRTVMQNADDARQANELAANAKELSNTGGCAVKRMLRMMEEIRANSRRVSEITAVIEGIAFQTNILALNAAVEAARAGEEGRGFAVVATEVRTLAQRSASAAKEIKVLLESSASTIHAGADQAVEVRRTMEQVEQAITAVSHIVREILDASEEQRRGIQDVSQAIAHIDDSTQRNAALVEQASAAAHALNKQAEQLNASASVFKLLGTKDSNAR